jgi:hypothetical protein
MIALVMRGQGSAEPVAVQQQIPGRCRCRLTIRQRGSNHVQRLTQAPVYGPQFLTPGNQPGLLALRHERAKGETTTSPPSFGYGASMPGTACHRHATLRLLYRPQRLPDAQPRSQERACAVERRASLGQLRELVLEHVRDTGNDIECYLDVVLCGLTGQPDRVVKQDLVRPDLDQQWRQAGQVREDRADQRVHGSQRGLLTPVRGACRCEGAVHLVGQEARRPGGHAATTAPACRETV